MTGRKFFYGSLSAMVEPQNQLAPVRHATPEVPVVDEAPATDAKTKAAGIALAAGVVGGFTWLFLFAKKKIEEKQGEAAFGPIVDRVAPEEGVPAWAMKGIIKRESAWSNKVINPPLNPVKRARWRCRNREGEPISCSEKYGTSCITSLSGAVGLAQVLPTTAGLAGEQLCDPETGIRAGAKYVRKLLNRYEGKVPSSELWKTVALAYNQGPGRVTQYQKSGATREDVFDACMDVCPDDKSACTTQCRREARMEVSKGGLRYARDVARYAGAYQRESLAGFLTTPPRGVSLFGAGRRV